MFYDHPIMVSCWNQSFPDVSLCKCIQDSVVTYRIPPDGTAYSPQLRELTEGKFDSEFTIEDFCPDFFCKMRYLRQVSNDQYYKSICQLDAPLMTFSSNSQGGAFFFLSHDKRFFLKTALRREAEALVRMMPNLLQRFESHPETLLSPFLGLYRLKGDTFDKDSFFFVMMAATQHVLPIHRSFDLKGSSSHGRYEKDPSVNPGKDRNFDEEFNGLGLSDEVARALLKTHDGDVALLTEYGCMDYSVFVEVHECHRPPVRPTHSHTLAGSMTIGPAAHDSRTAFGRKVTCSIDMEVCPGGILSTSANTGYRSADERFVYTIALIDLLVPFRLEALESGVATVRSSGVRPESLARISPEAYASRQKKMLLGICTTKHNFSGASSS